MQPSRQSSGIHSEDYIHCGGTPLKLTDSDLGSEQYSSSDYYVWHSGSWGSQLLFIFPTRINLTTITLHYYSDSIRGLPRLRFWAVPDGFAVWDALSSSYSHVDVAAVQPDGESAGLRNISIASKIYSRKMLMYISISFFDFALSEVDFFTNSVYVSVHMYM